MAVLAVVVSACLLLQVANERSYLPDELFWRESAVAIKSKRTQFVSQSSCVVEFGTGHFIVHFVTLCRCELSVRQP